MSLLNLSLQHEENPSKTIFARAVVCDFISPATAASAREGEKRKTTITSPKAAEKKGKNVENCRIS